MDAIKSAVQSLENISPTRSGKHQDVEIAITQLRSTVELLELHTLTPSAVRKLSDLLRQPLLPLYRSTFLSALEYAAAIYRFVHQNKILSSLESRESMYPWENILVSLFSGILDFLEELITEKQSLNSKYGKSVGSTIFPLLCPVFFRPLSGHGINFDGDLSSVVYQLLMTTVTSYPPNAARLRDDIGGKRLGITISRTKEFLAMESLLELFAVLVPSAQDGREKRKDFIATVFHPSIFSCSGRIIQCLESLASPDWTITSAAIVDALAASDIAFPQPFGVQNLAVNNEPLHQASSFHVDKSQFIANIEKDGKIETFHLPFSTIRNIYNSPSDNGDADVHIVIGITKPAILGDRPIEAMSIRDMTVSLDLKKSLLKKFERVLKNRNLNIAAIVTRKQSKTKEIELNFDISNRNSGVLKQEKVQSLSRLWANDTIPAGDGPSDPYVTSPLVLQSASKTIVDLRLIPAGSGVSLTRNNQGPSADAGASSLFNQSSDDENPQPKSKSAKSVKRVIYSDDEGPPSIAHEDRQSSSNLMNAKVAGFEKKSLLYQSTTKAYASTKPTEALLDSLPAESTIDDRKQKHNDLVHCVEKSKKRQASEVEDMDRDVNKGEDRSVKRLRCNPVDISPVAATRSVQVTKDAKKGRSSPLTVDFDELPQPEVYRPIVRSSKLRSSRMKDKSGKPAPKAKRVAVKESIAEIEERVDPDITLIDIRDKAVQSSAKSTFGQPEDAKERRRSARVARILASSGKEENKQRKQTTFKRPQKAPWEEKEFLKRKHKPVAIHPGSNEEGPPMLEGISDEITKDLPRRDRFLREGSVPYSENYTDFLVPLKSASISSNHLPANPDSNAITIDLTQEDSPIAQRVNRKASTAFEKSLTQATSKDEQDEQTNATALGRLTDVRSSSKSKVEQPISSPFDTGTIKNPFALSPGEGKTRTVKVGPTSFLPDAKGREGQHEEQFNARYTERRLKNVYELWPKDQTCIRDTRGAFLSPLESGKSKSKSNVGFAHLRLDDLSQRIENKKKTSEEQGIPAGRIQSRGRTPRLMQQKEHPQKNQNSGSGFVPEAPLQRIVKIFDEINQAVIDKICRRFDGVTEELHSGQRAILEATAGIAKEMCNTSARHFNDMIDLEADYTMQRKKITRGLDDYLKATEQLSLCFKDIVNQHNHRSLSRKFPVKLFDKVPAIIKNPKLNL